MPSRDENLLEVSSLDVHYGHGQRRKQILENVSCHVARGEAVGLIGETGSGKSTLARSILGLVKTDSGSVTIDGRQVTDFGKTEWTRFRREGVVQYVFQDPLRSLDAAVKIGQSIAEPLLIRGDQSRTEVTDRVLSLLGSVNLDEELIDRFPGELSGGQRQRVALARALVTSPQLLILDEPVSALDSANRVQVLEILADLRDSGIALLFISHDLGSVAGITNRTMVLYKGGIVEDNDTAEVVNNPRHPYTQLLVGSAPTLAGGSISKERREELRVALQT